MIVWTGAGVVVPFIWLLVFLLFMWLENVFPVLKNHIGLFMGTQLALTGLLCWLFSKLLGKEKGRVVIDKATNQEITLEKKHSLFFIPVFYWSFIFWAMSGYLLVSDAVKYFSSSR